MRSLPLFLAAAVAGLCYMAGWGLPLPDWAAIAWKGAGVGLLAIWAGLQGRTTNHRLLTTVLTLGATADMVLELQFVPGAAIFAVGHVVAITLYLRNRRAGIGPRDAALAILFIAGTIFLASRLATPTMALPVAVYALFLSAMAASALLSRFPVAAAGALLFVASDLLIFARMQSLAAAPWADAAIWLSYFAGQALIAWGVAHELDSRAVRA